MIFVVALAGAGPAGLAQKTTDLPDAPQPALETAQQQSGSGGTQNGDIQIQKVPGKPDPGKAGSIGRAPLDKRMWARYVDPGERVPVLQTSDKMSYWLHEEVRWYAPLPAFVSAGFGQLTDGDPKYGTDSGAFGERLGTALIRQVTDRFFADSLFAAMFGEDPRYYRKASGSYGSRGVWVVEQALVGRRNSGHLDFNNSNIWGHLAASALTQAYYPDSSRGAGIVMQTWGYSILGSMGNNEFLEFWPDAINALRRHRERKKAAAGE